MRVESVLECVPCARVSNQIIVYTCPNYRNNQQPTQSHYKYNVFIGDFNLNWLNETDSSST